MYKSLVKIAQNLKSLAYFLEISKEDKSLPLKIADLDSKTSELLNLIKENKSKISILDKYFQESKDLTEEKYLAGSKISAINKGHQVLAKLKDLDIDISNYAFVSLGGGNGTELYTEIENSKANYGLLLEYDFHSVHDFVKKYVPFQLNNYERIDEIDIEVIECDLFDKVKLDIAKTLISDWNVDGIIISIHAVLHELSTRSQLKSNFLARDKDGNLDLEPFFRTIYEWHDNIILLIREPGIAENWKNETNIYLKFKEEYFEEFKNILIDINGLHFGGSEGVNFQVYEEQKKIRCIPTLAMEALTKLFYKVDYEYEKTEKITSISREILIESLKVGGSLFKIMETNPFYTDSVKANMKKFGVEITKKGDIPLGLPQCFSYTIASKGEHNKISD
ncbi:hypothetical protein [Maribacter sp. 2308TA10-17]|uniref:hypothetical protein n=1 Tax=Maribacter sp. 2308TA10-17 TaxID=3386276 RepID=UPI0039BD7D99